MIKAAIIGHPVAHSKSPLIHQHWIARYGLPGEYTAIDIAPENLRAGIDELIAAGFAGFNATVPHKEALLGLCDEADKEARQIGAVNTVVIRNGHLHGCNTDAFGFIENIRQNAPGYDFAEGPALVLGAGGAARAIVHGLLKAGTPEIIVTNRTRDKAENIAASCAAPALIRVADWADRTAALDGSALLVNATVLGMAGQPPLDLDLVNLPGDALVTDIVYTPLYTPLLENAQQKGNPVVTGIGMLLHQARPAFARWFGVEPEVTKELEDLVLR